MLLLSLWVTACAGPQSRPVVMAATAVISSPTAVEAIEIAVDQSNPPFMYEDKNGQAAGLYPILLRAVFERMGVQAQVNPYPWKRALDMGEKGQVGVGGIYKNTRRLQIFDYSEVLYSEKIVLYVRTGQAFQFSKIQDLQGKTIGTLTGWSYGDEFDLARERGGFVVEEVGSDDENFKKLLLGRLDCIAVIELGAAEIILKEHYDEQIEELPVPLAVNDTYLVFAKNSPQAELLKNFNAILRAMKLDGSYVALIRTWQAQRK